MARALYGRRVAVTVGSTAGGAGRRVEGLRVAWRVIMTASSLPFEAQVEIWNPTPATIAACRAPDAQVLLEAGYDQPGVIFRGEPIRGGVRVTRRGPDTILALDLADAWRERVGAWFARDYQPQTPAVEIVGDAIAALGLAVGAVTVPGSLRYPRGISFAGPAADALDEIAESVGASWRVDGGAVYFGPDFEPSDVADVGPLLTPSTGLVGSPTLRGDVGGDAVEVRALLLPTMRPGRPFRVQSREITGDFVAQDVQHVGDSGFDAPFYTEIVAVPR